MIRFAAIGCLMILGLSITLAQDRDHAAQKVSFAVHRTNVFSTSNAKVENIMPPRMKVTISSDQPLQMKRVQLDAKMMRPEKLAEAFKSKSLLVTLTD